jgi:uncharacterized delta-60 repeat protein
MTRISILIILLFATGLAYGQAGYLDKTFGDGGVVNIDFGWGSSIIPYDIHILPDGKIIHSGRKNDNGIFLMKHHSNGRVDSSFGDQGIAQFSPIREATDLKLYCYPDGRFLVYGYRGNPHDAGILPFIVRFLANGTIDNTFGNDGMYEQPKSITSGLFKRIKVDSTGMIIALGEAVLADALADKFLPCISHITSLGKNDTSFGNMGIKSVGSVGDTSGINDAIIYSEDKCIFSVQSPSSESINILCCDLNGVLDSSFGTDGRIMMNLSDGKEWVIMMISDRDGSILCMGAFQTLSRVKPVLMRILSTGSVDNSFGEFGIAPIPNDGYERSAYYVALDSNQNIIQCGGMDSSSYYFNIAMHYLHDGKIDSSWGVNGTSKELPENLWDIYSVATDNDGKFVVAGYEYKPNHSIGILCRLNNIGKAQVSSSSKIFSSASLHPTPSAENCTVTYTLPSSGDCIMTLRDESGREVKTFATSGFRTVGEHKEELDLRGLASGVYFLQIESGGTIQTAKLIKQ